MHLRINKCNSALPGSRVKKKGSMKKKVLNLRQFLKLTGAGSPQAQRIVMLRQSDLPEKTRQAKKVIGLGKDKK
jgi:hypothetical protein